MGRFRRRLRPFLPRQGIESARSGPKMVIVAIEMTIYDRRMDISVTDFKARCLDLIRGVEKTGKAITIRRRGRVVARLEPAGNARSGLAPWEELRAMGGRTHMSPEESVWKEEDFEAMR